MTTATSTTKLVARAINARTRFTLRVAVAYLLQSVLTKVLPMVGDTVKATSSLNGKPNSKACTTGHTLISRLLNRSLAILADRIRTIREVVDPPPKRVMHSSRMYHSTNQKCISLVFASSRRLRESKLRTALAKVSICGHRSVSN